MSGLAVCLFVPIATVATAAAPSDWQQHWEKALTGAKSEGKVVVWGPPGELIRKAMTEGFSKAHPDIPIEYSGARGGEQATRIRAERDGGIYSVDVLLSGTTTASVRMKPIKALDPIEPALPPADGKYFSGEPKPGDRYWLSHSEENVQRSAEETKILKELFGR